MDPIKPLLDTLAALDNAILGYSGGVDSSLLAVAARRALGPDRFLAVIGRSASYPAVQYAQAVGLARQFDVPLFELDTQELGDARYRANAPDRCFYCKHELWSELTSLATERGFSCILDGTNASDTGEHRPGMRAAAEFQVRSPLAELGWTKAQVRQASRALGLPNWDAPAAPCLASRIRYGVEVTPERLEQVERAEELVRSLGVRGNLRVRHLDTMARIEVDADEMNLVREHWDVIERQVAALGFVAVELDERGYRRGALLSMTGAG
ncbi:MAG TPA: ATP-dependent sacrificial sulfur transferase LarE [Gemmatimonadales bacterium]|nr:ATP-dependent sacrificial sulfur transferase LarE [Gemmatimonadales bacterium]